ncbi:MAG: bifunctional precorrin-2 dehydrogenase/sirohydrochlorin ferrochelatase [Bacteroidetes bacterium]|nr:bifunctional precorrin-2 dehydrogenase/sirohydrochlorin ferrochelatase [Bacteroidota bacterium]
MNASPLSVGNNDMNKLYPIFLKLEEMKLLIVGGGNVALEKLNSVLSNSPQTQIEIVAPLICREIRKISSDRSNVRFSERKIASFDIDLAQIIIVAVDDRTVSEWVHLQAKAKGKLINVADAPDLCDFYLGSIVNKGHLKIAISTNGKSPTMAKRLKEFFSEVLPNMDDLLGNLNSIRNKLKGNLLEKVKVLNKITSEIAHHEPTL